MQTLVKMSTCTILMDYIHGKYYRQGSTDSRHPNFITTAGRKSRLWPHAKAAETDLSPLGRGEENGMERTRNAKTAKIGFRPFGQRVGANGSRGFIWWSLCLITGYCDAHDSLKRVRTGRFQFPGTQHHKTMFSAFLPPSLSFSALFNKTLSGLTPTITLVNRVTRNTKTTSPSAGFCSRLPHYPHSFPLWSPARHEPRVKDTGPKASWLKVCRIFFDGN